MKLDLLVILISSVLLFSVFVGVTPVRADFDLSSVAYYDKVKNVLGLTVAQEDMLRQYGFVSVPTNITTFENFYGDLVWRKDLPVIVTTDSFLQLFHVVFDCSLRTLEKNTFYPMLLNLTSYAFNASQADYAKISHDGSQKQWAIGNATIYFAVALSLLTNTTVSVPPELSSDVAFYLGNIWSSNPQFITAAEWTPSGVQVSYDFTQFTVRGHYVGDPQLSNYFRAMTWYGQFPVFIPRANEDYVWSAPHIDALAMVYMDDVMQRNPQCFKDWELVYNVTNALVGKSDGINPLNLETALHKVFGDHEEYLDSVVQPNGATALRNELEKPEYAQSILSQALMQPTSGAINEAYPLVFQFMGKRVVPDSYIFQNLCWPKVGSDSAGDRRILPNGLDVFAVAGSERAVQLLAPDYAYQDFGKNLASLTQEFGGWSEQNWTQSSYTAWMYALQSLVNINYTSNYPEFMKNLAWQDEKLNTALGSWAQLRHDTILYAAQFYSSGMTGSYPEAYLEPNPTFYSRMRILANQTLQAVQILNPQETTSGVSSSLEDLINESGRFITISTEELAGKPLTPDEVAFLKSLVQTSGGLCGGPVYTGWYYNQLMSISYLAGYVADLDSQCIADVATFPPGDTVYPPQILHVGTGNVNALVAIFPLTNGTLVTGVGPIFSYYEFPLIGTKRLNDKEWIQMLSQSNMTSYLSEQLKDVEALGTPYPPEAPNIIPRSPERPNMILLGAILIGPILIAAIALVATMKKVRIKSSTKKLQNQRKNT